jgi:uncharacterized membrane protein
MPDPGQFHMATVHLYRGEMQRMVVWRSRLDQTTHWALLLTAGITTFALGAVLVPHFIMLLGLAINTLCMIIEGRRYQHLHHSKWRINLLEHNYFAEQLGASCPLEAAWRHQLACDLQRPHFTIRHSLGVRLRLRRNYLLLAYFITAVWLTKLFIHPTSVSSVAELYQRLAVGTLLPSWFVAASAALFIGAVTVMAVLTPSEERLERWTKEERTRLVSASDVQVWETRKQGPHQ